VIPGVLRVPKCGRNNLLSVSQQSNSGYYIDFHRTGGASFGRDDVLSITLREVNGLFILQTRSAQGSVRALAAHGGEVDEGKLQGRKQLYVIFVWCLWEQMQYADCLWEITQYQGYQLYRVAFARDAYMERWDANLFRPCRSVQRLPNHWK